jgi:small subunit ribosomal protein S6
MALYEHVFLARQDLSQQQVDELVTQYKGIVEAAGGSVGRVENWGLKSLTYRIQKNRKAYYTLMDITAPAAAVKEIERLQGLSEDVLRFLTIKVEKHEEGVSAMMQKRDDRERGDRDGRPGGGRFGDRDRGDRGPRSFGDRDRGGGGGFGGDRGDRGDRGGFGGGDREDRGPRRPREEGANA